MPEADSRRVTHAADPLVLAMTELTSVWGRNVRPAGDADSAVPDDPIKRRDLILLERARDGDLDSFNDLVTLYQDQLFALVVRMVPDRDQASDCVQEAFFSAFRNLST